MTNKREPVYKPAPQPQDSRYNTYGERLARGEVKETEDARKEREAFKDRPDQEPQDAPKRKPAAKRKARKK